MATKEAVEKKIVPYSAEDLVEIPPLFYDQERYSASARVCVNGKMYMIPRGVSGLKVPRVVAEILEQSQYQKQFAGRFSKSIEGIKNMGDF